MNANQQKNFPTKIDEVSIEFFFSIELTLYSIDRCPFGESVDFTIEQRIDRRMEKNFHSLLCL